MNRDCEQPDHVRVGSIKAHFEFEN